MCGDKNNPFVAASGAAHFSRLTLSRRRTMGTASSDRLRFCERGRVAEAKKWLKPCLGWWVWIFHSFRSVQERTSNSLSLTVLQLAWHTREKYWLGKGWWIIFLQSTGCVWLACILGLDFFCLLVNINASVLRIVYRGLFSFFPSSWLRVRVSIKQLRKSRD